MYPNAQRAAERIASYDVMYKMVLCVRNDLNMGKGKIVSQACHGVMRLTLMLIDENQDLLRKYLLHETKITLKINSESELIKLRDTCVEKKLHHIVIEDAGKTQVDPGTKTVLAIIGASKEIDEVVKHLKLL